MPEYLYTGAQVSRFLEQHADAVIDLPPDGQYGVKLDFTAPGGVHLGAGDPSSRFLGVHMAASGRIDIHGDDVHLHTRASVGAALKSQAPRVILSEASSLASILSKDLYFRALAGNQRMEAGSTGFGFTLASGSFNVDAPQIVLDPSGDFTVAGAQGNFRLRSGPANGLEFYGNAQYADIRLEAGSDAQARLGAQNGSSYPTFVRADGNAGSLTLEGRQSVYINTGSAGGAIIVGNGADEQVLIGGSTGNKVGFFGNTPIAQADLSSGSATNANIVTALGNLGLVNVTA